jgi:hypothetical protein
MRGLILLVEIIGALAVVYFVGRSVMKLLSPDEVLHRNLLARIRRQREREAEIRALEEEVEREDRRLKRILGGSRRRRSDEQRKR